MSVAEPAAEQQIHTFYCDHHRWLRDWLRRRLDCPEQAADLAHDTFVRVLRHRERVDGLRQPRAWLATIARNLLFNHFQRQSLERAYLDVLSELPETLVPSLEYQALLLETLHEIDAVLSALPLAVRKVFLLVQLDGLGYAEVAEQMSISVRTVQRHLVRAYEQCILLAPWS